MIYILFIFEALSRLFDPQVSVVFAVPQRIFGHATIVGERVNIATSMMFRYKKSNCMFQVTGFLEIG